MSESEFKGTKLSVVQGIKNGILCGTFQKTFKLDNGVDISISQAYKREIEISSDFPISNDELVSIFQNLQKILLLFDGRFYTIEKMFIANNAESIDILSEYNGKSLNCFISKDIYQCSLLKIISFQDVLTNELYKKGISLIEDLDIAFQMFLYALSDNKMTVDLNFAFLVELAEPFVELIKERTHSCQSLKPGKRGTTLKLCIDNLIELCGTDIFEKELNDKYTSFLDTVVSSRVRIMHIKKNQENYFDKNNCIKYSLKFSLLYRRIILLLLDVPYEQYKKELQHTIKKIDEGNFWR